MPTEESVVWMENLHLACSTFLPTNRNPVGQPVVVRVGDSTAQAASAGPPRDLQP